MLRINGREIALPDLTPEQRRAKLFEINERINKRYAPAFKGLALSERYDRLKGVAETYRYAYQCMCCNVTCIPYVIHAMQPNLTKHTCPKCGFYLMQVWARDVELFHPDRWRESESKT